MYRKKSVTKFLAIIRRQKQQLTQKKKGHKKLRDRVFLHVWLQTLNKIQKQSKLKLIKLKKTKVKQTKSKKTPTKRIVYFKKSGFHLAYNTYTHFPRSIKINFLNRNFHAHGIYFFARKIRQIGYF